MLYFVTQNDVIPTVIILCVIVPSVVMLSVVMLVVVAPLQAYVAMKTLSGVVLIDRFGSILSILIELK
jgi:hypothetical protein